MATSVTFSSHGKPIGAELYSPPSAPNGGAVVIVHGSAGLTDPWAAMIRQYGTDLAAKGYTVLLPKYFEKTGTTAGPGVFAEIPTNLTQWCEAVSDAVTHIKTLPKVAPARIGLLGFSLGGHVALRLRASAKVLVEFFAPELHELGGILSKAAVPHVQIHHGLADPLVPFVNAKAIEKTLKSDGSAPQVFSYKGAGHGFDGVDPDNTAARLSSQHETLNCFQKHL